MNYSDTIWRLFLEKIESDWENKYFEYGSGIFDVVDGKQIAMSNAIIADIKENFKDNGIKSKIIDPLVLHGFIQKNGPSSRAKEQTLSMFVRYLGFKDWIDFKNAHQKSLSNANSKEIEMVKKEGQGKSSENSSISLGDAQQSVAEKSDRYTKNQKIYTTILFVVLGFLAVYFVTDSQKNQFTDTEKEMFEKIIDDANNTELKIYKSVPIDSNMIRIEDEKLNNFFTKDGTAKEIIIGGAIKATRENRKLRSPPSSYTKVDIFFKERRENEVKIETDEQWYLLWYDLKSNKDTKLFDTLNHHIYVLKFMEGKWKIHMDEYRGRPKKVMQ
jgi:hypothetical protein